MEKTKERVDNDYIEYLIEITSNFDKNLKSYIEIYEKRNKIWEAYKKIKKNKDYKCIDIKNYSEVKILNLVKNIYTMCLFFSNMKLYDFKFIEDNNKKKINRIINIK